MKLLYFAWVRQKIGRSEETVSVPPSVSTVAALIDFIKARGEGYQAAFADLKLIRCAVNQHHAPLDAPVAANDEVAFFPPVTGG